MRKEKPKEEAFEYKKRLTLDHEKSKLSLAEIYEQEYIKQTQVSFYPLLQIFQSSRVVVWGCVCGVVCMSGCVCGQSALMHLMM